MKKNLIFFVFFLMIFTNANATPCASQIFANALAQTADTVTEQDEPDVIKEWIYKTFYNHKVLSSVLNCPEISSVPETETIKFAPIKYTFPGGREIIVNYETQPKILKQRLTLGQKRSLPSSDPNPKIGEDGDTVWTNTDPAWYGIMVVESGTLDEFVGPDKNNTISMKYINDNFDSFYPRGLSCTSETAWTGDGDAINRAMIQTVSIKDDSNDYYVAGNKNLEWVGYAEIALDVAITVLTAGTGTVVLGATKAPRAARALKGLRTTLKQLRNVDAVRDHIKISGQAAKLADEIKTLDKVKDAAKIADKQRELNKINDTLKTLENSDDVKKYKEASKTYSELNKYRHELRGVNSLHKIAQRGNIFARTVRVGKGVKAAFSGNKLINKAAKLGRSSKLSGQIRDYLFHSTLRNAGALAKLETIGSLAFGALGTIGGLFWDFTETSTDEFTSGVDFKPLLLLSADDIAGQEDTINYGMWLMWMGNSTNATDDDAAYLQVMDFAAKFYEDLTEVQDNTNTPCNVDIFVVRPVLRNPGQDNAELYYLIMNDIPWSTNPQ